MPRKSKSTLIEAPAVLSDPVVSQTPTFSSPVIAPVNNSETKKPAAKRTKKVSTEETIVVNPPVVTQTPVQLVSLRSENVEPVKKGRA